MVQIGYGIYMGDYKNWHIGKFCSKKINKDLESFFKNADINNFKTFLKFILDLYSKVCTSDSL